MGVNRVGVWVRVSSADQVRDESPEVHLSRARAYAEAHGWEVAAVYRLDGISGETVINRPQARQMLHDARTGLIDGLLFSSLARVGRDMIELLLIERDLRQMGVRLLSIRENIDTSTPEGADRFRMLASRAQNEREELSARVAAGYATRRRRGEVTSRAPYGYQRINRTLTPHPTEAPIRAEMFALYLEHRRLKTVAQILNERGYRTRAGKPWSKVSVHFQLTDPVVTGRFISNRWQTGKVAKPESEWVDVPVPAIVPPETFERVQRVIASQRANHPPKKPKTPYSGLLACACGQRLYYRRASAARRARYSCRGCRDSIRLDALDQAVGRILVGIALDQAGITLTQSEALADPRAGLLRAAQAEAALLESRRDRLVDLFQAEAIDLADFRRRHDPLVARQAELMQEIRRLEADLSADRDRQRDGAAAVDLLASVAWADLEPVEKGGVLRLVTDQILLTPEAIEIEPTFLPEGLIVGDLLAQRDATSRCDSPLRHRLKLSIPRPDRLIAALLGLTLTALRAWGQGRGVAWA